MPVLQLDHPALLDYGHIPLMGNQKRYALALQRIFSSLQPKGPSHIWELCSGSATVTRLLKAQGWVVSAFDSEPFAVTLAKHILQSNDADMQRALHKKATPLQWGDSVEETIHKTWSHLSESDAYFQAHYSPHAQSTRKYFTPEVAHWLDHALTHVFETSSWPAEWLPWMQYEILRLMLQHANCSGTMKSYHQQWGGKTHTRQQWIQSVPQWSEPFSIAGPPGQARIGKAHEILLAGQSSAHPLQAIYIDPPSSVHQYSANYHLLNSMVVADRWTPDKESMGGIRDDSYSSDFSRRARVQEYVHTVHKLAQAYECPVVWSYPIDGGLLSGTQLESLLKKHSPRVIPVFAELEQVFFVCAPKTLHISLPAENCWNSMEQARHTKQKDKNTALYVGAPLNPQKCPPLFRVHYDHTREEFHIMDGATSVVTLDKYHQVVRWEPCAIPHEAHWASMTWEPAALFCHYLAEKKWVKAIRWLRHLRKHSPTATYQACWYMAEHATRALGVTKYHEVVSKLQKTMHHDATT